MFNQKIMDTLLISIFILLLVLIGYLVALPTILEGKGIDIKKLKTAAKRKKK